MEILNIKKDEIFDKKSICRHIENYNQQVGMRLPTVEKRPEGWQKVSIQCNFLDSKYTNIYDEKRELLIYKMQNSGRGNTLDREVNKCVISEKGAFAYVEVNKGRYKYLGWIELVDFIKEKEEFYFKVPKKDMKDSMFAMHHYKNIKW